MAKIGWSAPWASAVRSGGECRPERSLRSMREVTDSASFPRRLVQHDSVLYYGKPALDHHSYRAEIADAHRWITVNHEHVCNPSSLQRTDLIADANGSGRFAGGRMNRL